MKQQVNLYALRPRRETPVLGATRLLQLGAAGLGLLLLLSAHAAWQNRRAEARLAALRTERAAESARVVELAELHPPQALDAGLEAELARLGGELEARARLLSLLAGGSLGNAAGFSEQLTGLARRRIEGLWLRAVRIRSAGAELALEGSAVSPELVPRLLRELGAEQAFAGTAFESLRLERHESQPDRVDFAIQTHAEPTP